MFPLSDAQRATLAAARAWQQEGERRYEHWSRREAQAAAAEAFRALLGDSSFRSGQPLPAGTRDQLLRLASEIAPNANLSKRLYTHGAQEFDRRLRALLFGPEPLESRLRQFLAARGTGAQTASGLLCAFAPDTYPVITQTALRRLRLSAAQKREALAQAGERYGFTVTEADAAQRLLALFVVFEAVRDALGVATYPEVNAALRADWALPSSGGSPARRVHEPAAHYGTEPSLTETALLASLEEYALGQGFTYPAPRLRSYYVALKTKPFVILSGVSGTGKTKMAELFAEAMTGNQPAQFRLIPVRPDWNDSTALFGYHNILANRYVATPFLDMARTAGQPENRHRAYFVCLDEMNLARVEHYLSDYLSAQESRSRRIPLHDDTPDLILPPNLFLTGTVNVDETTHTFSRKVLDRANTLDFDEPPRLREEARVKGSGLVSEPGSPAQRQALFLSARVLTVGRARERLARLDAGFPEYAVGALQAANDLLYPYRLHFAYRVRDEILMFLANSFDAETGQGLLRPEQEGNFRLALDLQALQKILPKLNGLPEQLETLLGQIQAWAEGWELSHTAAKLTRMRAQARITGYIRFGE